MKLLARHVLVVPLVSAAACAGAAPAFGALPLATQHASVAIHSKAGRTVVRESVRCTWRYNHHTMKSWTCTFTSWHAPRSTWHVVSGGGASSIAVDPLGIVRRGESRITEWANAWGRCVTVSIGAGGNRDGTGSTDHRKRPCASDSLHPTTEGARRGEERVFHLAPPLDVARSRGRIAPR
jgi:hypothetical protein